MLIVNLSIAAESDTTFDDPRRSMVIRHVERWMSRVNNKRFGSIWISGSRLEVIAARIAASPRPRTPLTTPRPPAAVSKQSGVYPHLARTDRSAACRGALAVPIIFVTGIAPKPIPASSRPEESEYRASPRPRSPAGSRLVRHVGPAAEHAFQGDVRHERAFQTQLALQGYVWRPCAPLVLCECRARAARAVAARFVALVAAGYSCYYDVSAYAIPCYLE